MRSGPGAFEAARLAVLRQRKMLKKRLRKRLRKRQGQGISKRIKKMTKNMITMIIKKDLLGDRPADEVLLDLNELEEDVDLLVVDHEPIDPAFHGCKDQEEQIADLKKEDED